jgi:SAM-dependent methyltransferase
MELLLGCGRNKTRVIRPNGVADWRDLTTLDINEEVIPDVVWDLNNIPLPFPDNSADEIHAYSVLEHIGAQGDYRFFFTQFEDFWRVLKPGGFFCGIVPQWDKLWSFGDPGHTRIIHGGTLTFLDQKAYEECGKTARTDYRFCYNGNFEIVYLENVVTEDMYFILKAVK